jgi:hypothetical protein
MKKLSAKGRFLRVITKLGGMLPASLRPFARRVWRGGRRRVRAHSSRFQNAGYDETEWTLVITAVEICDRHGTGVLLRKLIGSRANILNIRSRTRYFGECSLDCKSIALAWDRMRPPNRLKRLSSALGNRNIGTIIVVPYRGSELEMALAVKAICDAKLVTWVMDDNCVFTGRIPPDVMQRCLDLSDITFGISRELCDAYQAAFGVRMYLLPPNVEDRDAPGPDCETGNGRALMVGNVWSRNWLRRLSRAVAKTDLSVDWYGNTETAEQEMSELMDEAGIVLKGFIPESELLALAPGYDFAIVPTSALDDGEEDSSRIAIARLSLPSRIPTLMAAARIPIVVVGDPETAAGNFVIKTGIGVCSPYETEPLRETFESVRDISYRKSIRERCGELASVFSSNDLFEWVESSADSGIPVDTRFEDLLPPSVESGSSFVFDLPTGASRLWEGFRVFEVLRKNGTTFDSFFVLGSGRNPVETWRKRVSLLSSHVSTTPDLVFGQLSDGKGDKDSPLRHVRFERIPMVPPSATSEEGDEEQEAIPLAEKELGSFELNEEEAGSAAGLGEKAGISGHSVLVVDSVDAETFLNGSAENLRSFPLVVVELSLETERQKEDFSARLLRNMEEAGYEYFERAVSARHPKTGWALGEEAFFLKKDRSRSLFA